MHTRKRFVITRRVSATVGSRSDHEQLQPKAPYTRKKRVYVPFMGEIKHGLRPTIWTRTPWAARLPEFQVPEELARAASGVRGKKALHQVVRRMMPTELSLATYARYFQTLLYIEEEEMKYVCFMKLWIHLTSY